MVGILRLPDRADRRTAVAAPPAGRIDVDEELSAQYLAAVVRVFGERGLPVDTAVLHHPTGTRRRTPVVGTDGGTVFFALRADPPPGRPLPLCARWDGGRCWTVVTGQADGTAVRRARLHGRHTPAPADVADFVVMLVGGSRGTSGGPHVARPPSA